MHDILPEEMAAWHFLEESAKAVFAGYGFEEIRIPNDTEAQNREDPSRLAGGGLDYQLKPKFLILGKL